MAKGQGRIQNTSEQRSAQEYQATQEARNNQRNNPILKAREARVAARRKAIELGTVADDPEFMSNKSAVAQREQQRRNRANLTSTGVGGLASNYANPTMVAMQEKALKDQFSRDSAYQAHADLAGYMAETNAMEADVQNTQLGIEGNIMAQAGGMSMSNQQLAAQIAAQRASIAPALIGAAIGGAAQVASAWFTPSTPR